MLSKSKEHREVFSEPLVTPFQQVKNLMDCLVRARLTNNNNNYKACYCNFKSRSSVPQMDFYRHFSAEGHHRFLEDVLVKIIDRLSFGKNRIRESFWQHKLDTFNPRGFNIKEVEI